MRSIVRNCYRHHGREDLLHIFGDDGSLGADQTQAGQYTGTMVQTINNPDGTVSIIQIDTGPNSVVTLPDGTQATVVHSMTAVSISLKLDMNLGKKSGLNVLKLFSCSTQLSMKFQLLIKTKIPTSKEVSCFNCLSEVVFIMLI